MSRYTGVAYSRLTVQNLEVDNLTAGGLTAASPLTLPAYDVASVPDATEWENGVILVTDGAGGDPIIAFSDGTDWLRSDTGAAISDGS